MNQWNVLKTKSNYEYKVERELAERRIKCYLPKQPMSSDRGSRGTGIPKALFPGYVFVLPAKDQMRDIDFIPGSCGLIAFNNRPGTVSENEILALRALTGSRQSVSMHSHLQPGQKIKVLQGAFKGLTGELVR